MITISNGRLSARIKTRGAELASFMDNVSGIEYIWGADPLFWGESAPVLFPIVCDTRNGRFLIDGKEYRLHRHGFAKDMDFQIVSQAEDRVCLMLSYSEETLRVYPFKFELSINYILEQERLRVIFSVHNPCDGRMYYQIGWHPGFLCPMYPGDTFSDYLIEFEKAETSFCPVLNTETRLVEQNRRRDFLSNSNILNLNHLMFDDDALIFDTLLSRKVSLLNKVRRQGIEIAYPGFEMLGIWTPSRKSAPFLCIEPWNGTATYTDEDDDLRHKRGIQSLMSRETRQYEVFLNIVG